MWLTKILEIKINRNITWRNFIVSVGNESRMNCMISVFGGLHKMLLLVEFWVMEGRTCQKAFALTQDDFLQDNNNNSRGGRRRVLRCVCVCVTFSRSLSWVIVVVVVVTKMPLTSISHTHNQVICCYFSETHDDNVLKKSPLLLLIIIIIINISRTVFTI